MAKKEQEVKGLALTSLVKPSSHMSPMVGDVFATLLFWIIGG